MSINETDAAWINRLRLGDEDAFRRLIDEYQDRVFNTIISIIQHEQDAEDLTQEVFLKIYSGISGFRGESGLSTWIYRLSVNVSLDWERKKKTQKTFLYFKNWIGIGQQEEAIPDFNHPGVILQQKEMANQIYRALKNLPSDQKTVFVLMKMEELSQKETAEIMGKSIKSIEGLYQRAKNNLQQQISSYKK